MQLKINQHTVLGQSILQLERFRTIRQFPCFAISSARDSPTYPLSPGIVRFTRYSTMSRKTSLSFREAGMISNVIIYPSKVIRACPSKLTDSRRKTVNHKILADRNKKHSSQLLLEQFDRLALFWYD